MTAPPTAYVTRDELAARLAEMELRFEQRIAALERRMDEHFQTQMRWMIGLLLPVYGLMIAALIFLYNAKP